MEKQEVYNVYDKLEELFSHRFSDFNHKSCEAKLKVENHQQLMNLICDLIKLCIRSLEDGEIPGDRHIPNPAFSVSEILRMVLDIMPHEHFEFIDELEKILYLQKKRNF